MLHYLSEDPWPLACLLGSAALMALVALKFTQQGRFLIGAGVALALALTVLGVERAWLTDAERIEAVVYDLAEAVETSDVDGVVAHLAPEIALDGLGGSSSEGPQAIAMLRLILPSTRFDYVRIGRLRTNAGQLSRAGRAEFRAHVMGTVDSPFSSGRNYMTPPEGVDWSLGFRETEPGTWKVTRITPMSPIPNYAAPRPTPVDRDWGRDDRRPRSGRYRRYDHGPVPGFDEDSGQDSGPRP